MTFDEHIQQVKDAGTEGLFDMVRSSDAALLGDLILPILEQFSVGSQLLVMAMAVGESICNLVAHHTEFEKTNNLIITPDQRFELFMVQARMIYEEAYKEKVGTSGKAAH